MNSTPLNMSFHKKPFIRKRQALNKGKKLNKNLLSVQAFPIMFMPYIEDPNMDWTVNDIFTIGS